MRRHRHPRLLRTLPKSYRSCRHPMFLVDDISVFVRIVDSKGLSAAGRALRITTAVVSNRLARLETRLGARLLVRTTRCMTLTEEGRVFYDHCRRVMAELKVAEERVLEMSGQPTGTLRICIASCFGRRRVAPLIPRFAAMYPDLNVEVQMRDCQPDIVAENFDIAVGPEPLAASSLIARRLGEEAMVACAAPAYLARCGEPHDPQSLARHSCLRLSKGMRVEVDWPFIDADHRPIAHALGGTLHSNCMATLHAWAVAGYGIVLAPRADVEHELASGSLVEILSLHKLRSEAAFAVMPPSRPQPVKTRAFLDFVLMELIGAPNTRERRTTQTRGDVVALA